MTRRRVPRRPAAIAAGLVGAALLAGCISACSAAKPTARPGPTAPTSSTAATAPSSAVSRHESAPRPAGVKARPGAPTTSPEPSTRPDARTVVHRADPCRHNHARQLVRVSIHRQHLWMCHRTHLVRDTAVTTGIVGRWTHTPRGTFHIQGLDRDSTLTLNTGQTYQVKYWIPFQAPLFGFHDSSWQTFPYGSEKYRTDGSHGCVHMPLRAIAFLYHWAHVGASVRIRE